MSVSSASKVELAEVGMLPQILSTLISSSRLLIQPGLFRRISITLPRTYNIAQTHEEGGGRNDPQLCIRDTDSVFEGQQFHVIHAQIYGSIIKCWKQFS